MGEWKRNKRRTDGFPRGLEGKIVEARHRDGEVFTGVVGEHDYLSEESFNTADGCDGDVMAYRIIEDDPALPQESHAHTFGIDGDTTTSPDGWPEDRIDVIGQNGNTGEHYEIDTSPERVENEAENVHVDMVNEPPHYKQGDIECIDAIKAALTPDEWRGYCKGNAIKYIWRERHKGGDESLQKADWYLNRLSK